MPVAICLEHIAGPGILADGPAMSARYIGVIRVRGLAPDRAAPALRPGAGTSTTTTTTLPCITARCILEAVVRQPPCAPDPVPQKIVGKLTRSVDAIEAMPGESARKAKRSLRLARRLLQAAARGAARSARGRKPKLAPVCAQAIGGATSRVVEGLQR